MAGSNPRVAAQHEDWLNLADPVAPWFSVPVMKRVFPQGLATVPPELRAEHKARWEGGGDQPGARTADDRTGYVAWLLRDGLRWGTSYLTGDDLPAGLAAGSTHQDVRVVPTGAFVPPPAAPLGIFDEPEPAADAEGDGGSGPGARVLVFVVPAGTDPRTRPPGDGWSATWVQRAALCCRRLGVRLGLVTDGDHLVLVNAPVGEATGWGGWRASEFAAEPVLLQSFWSLLRHRQFVTVVDGDTPEGLLAASTATQAEVTDQLGSQVRRAVELLVDAISRADRQRDGDLLAGVPPHEVYEAAVTVMMRLVFLLVAEENDLLPVGNPHYQRLYGVRPLREALERERREHPEALEHRHSAWYQLLATARAVHRGVRHDEVTVPAYGGALFDPDRFPFLEGRGRGSRWRDTPGQPVPVTDLDIRAILDALLVLRPRAGSGLREAQQLSYRQVDVEQVGFIYERMLDHDARAVASGDVMVTLRRLRSGDGALAPPPVVRLVELEARRIDGDKALASFLSNKAADDDGRKVGSAAEVGRALAQPVDSELGARLREACQGDDVLAQRLVPFAHLLRRDLRDRPQVFREGALYVTGVDARRASGTAYTTRKLADEVAEHTLAPLCYSPGPQDTPDSGAWRLRPSSELLGLKVCDPAVGSGAILVAACRYLAARVVDAWRAEGDPRATDEATAADDPTRLDGMVAALRLVAEHCCYGVDRNPMAVELAKLSLWLTTVAKDRPFTFLDHAIQAGDSLLGLSSLDELRALHYDPAEGRKRTIPVARWGPGGGALATVDRLVEDAVDLRHQVGELPTATPADVERKQALVAESDQRLAGLSAIADVLAGVALSTADANSRPRSVKRFTEGFGADAEVVNTVIEAVGTGVQAAAVAQAEERAGLRLDGGRPEGAPSRRPLHWPLAFPEVFSDGRSGFDALVGNPPFVGGQKITGAAGDDYRDFLVAWPAGGKRGSADLVAYFFLQAARVGRSLGFLATNSVAQGDSSEVGLQQLLVDQGWTIHRAVSSTTWPGVNSLEIAKVWATAGSWDGEYRLDERPVVGIDEMLYPAPRSGWRKQHLAANRDLSFQGSNVLGLGFTMSPAEAQALINRDPRNADVLFPYLGGADLNHSPTQTAPRWVINFFDWPEEHAREYPDCFAIVEEKVKPERAKNKRKPRRELWWRYAEPAPNLYRAISGFDRVLAIARVSKTVRPVFVDSRQVLNEKVVVIATDQVSVFGLLSSSIHWHWAVRHGTTLRTDPQYTPTDVFETFPFPSDAAMQVAGVDRVAEELDTFRAELMVANDQGLTSTYNRVHDPDERDPDIRQLRLFHRELDEAVREAYGWGDLGDLGHGFHEVRGQGVRFTLAPEVTDEVLDRLLELNRDRYQAEVAGGRHGSRPGSGPRRTGAPKAPPDNQGTLL